MLDDKDEFTFSPEALRVDLQHIKAKYEMLDDKDEFTTIEQLKADMELTSFKGFAEDIFLGHICLPSVSMLGKHKFIKWQLQTYAESLDRALNILVWNVR